MTTIPAPQARPATMPLLILGAGVFALLQSLVTPALPQIQADLDTMAPVVAWTLTAYLLSAGIATPLLGRVGDLYGREKVLVAVLLTLTLGCMVAGFAPNIGVLIAGRVLQGVGGAILPLAFGIIRGTMPAQLGARGIATISAVFGAGGGLGVVLAGPVADNFGYRWLFWGPGAIAVLIAIATARLLPTRAGDINGRVGWAGAGLLAGWLIPLLLGVTFATSPGISGWAIPLLISAIVVFAAWISVESRARFPLIDMRVMRLRSVWPANLAAVLFGAVTYAMFALIPQLATAAPTGGGLGLSITGAGLLLLPMLVTMFVAGLVSGRLGNLVSSRVQLIVASILAAVACAGLSVRHDSALVIAAAAGVLGVAAGAGIAAMSNLVAWAVPASQVAASTGMNANLRTIGGAVGTAALTAVALGSPTAGTAPGSGFTIGFAILAASGAAASIAAIVVPPLRSTR